MSCRCCQQGGDDSSEDDGDYEEQEDEDVQILSISALKERVQSLATFRIPPPRAEAEEQIPLNGNSRKELESICSETDQTLKESQPTCAEADQTLKVSQRNCAETDQTLKVSQPNCAEADPTVKKLHSNGAEAEQTLHFRALASLAGAEQSLQIGQLTGDPEADQKLDSGQLNSGEVAVQTLHNGNGLRDHEEEKAQVESRVQSLVEKGLTCIPTAYVRPVSERPRAALSLAGEVPVLDLSKDRVQLITSIASACAEFGFFQVINHGVPTEVLQAMTRDSREFFSLSMDEKMRYACKTGAIASEGYGSKMLVKDEQVLDWRDYFDLHTLPMSRRCPSNWPATPPSFRDTVVQYSNKMRVLAEKLLALISESLGLPSSYMKDVLGEPSQNVSVNYYPPCPQPELTLGLQAHSDLGAVTILMQADIAGLQVYKNGDWISVQPLTNSLVVNLGDMMEVLSNGKYKSVEHRAVVNAERDRLSIATFLDPAKDQLLSPAAPLINEKHPRRYKDILFRDFIAAWYSKGPDGKRNIDNLVVAS